MSDDKGHTALTTRAMRDRFLDLSHLGGSDDYDRVARMLLADFDALAKIADGCAEQLAHCLGNTALHVLAVRRFLAEAGAKEQTP